MCSLEVEKKKLCRHSERVGGARLFELKRDLHPKQNTRNFRAGVRMFIQHFNEHIR